MSQTEGGESCPQEQDCSQGRDELVDWRKKAGSWCYRASEKY